MAQLKAHSILWVAFMLLNGCSAALGRTPPTPAHGVLATSSAPAATVTLLPQDTPIPLPSPTPTGTPLFIVTPQFEMTSTVQSQLQPSEPMKERAQPLAAPAVETAADTLSGAWDFSLGIMDLSQRGSAIEGRYRWYGGGDTGRIQGSYLADLRQIRGLWVSDRDPTEQGFLRARLNNAGSKFHGTFERRTLSGLWCGTRSGEALPSGCGFSGPWQLRFGSPPNLAGQATLTQTGETVRGTFTGADGHSGEIEGQVTIFSITEARLVGAWRDNRRQTNTFEWRLDLTTGRTFAGRRDPGNSEWCGWRPAAFAPNPCGW